MSDQHFHYNLIRAGEAPITQTGSRQLAWTTSDLRQLDGTEDTGARDDFNTVAGSLADDSPFTRYGF